MKSVLVVGAGYWGTKCIDTLLHNFPSIVVKVVEKNADYRAGVSLRFPSLEVFGTLEEAIEKGDVKSAVITAPARWHGQLALTLLRAGIHVLVEKPFNLTPEEFAEASLHESRGLVVNAGYLYVHNPLISAVDKIVKSKQFGNLIFVESLREGFGAFRQDVNVVRDLMVHDISIALGLVRGQSWNIDSATARIPLNTGFFAEAEATMRFESGMVAKMVSSQFRPVKNRRTTFFLEDAIIVADEQNELRPFRVFSPPSGLLKTGTAEQWQGEEYAELQELDAVSFNVESPRKTLAKSLSSFLDSVASKVPNKADLTFAQEVDAIATAIESALERGEGR